MIRGIAWRRAVNGSWRARRADAIAGEIKIYDLVVNRLARVASRQLGVPIEWVLGMPEPIIDDDTTPLEHTPADQRR